MIKFSVFVLLLSVNLAMAEELQCYGSGSIAGAVIGTLIATLIILAVVYYVYKKIWKPRQEKDLILETDPEKGDAYAFDNPGFKDAGLTPIGKALEKNNSKLDTGKHKWSQWSPLGAFVSTKCEKKKTADDTCVDSGETKFVTLRSHDFTGLGFNIYGNMREGIFIKDVLHHGPASESGKLNSGDKILSLKISFEHMVYEDALTILSYASPYEVEIEAKSGIKSHRPASGQGAQPGHPLYKSSSSTDLMKIGKSARSRLFGDSFDNTMTTDLSILHMSSNNTSLNRSHKSSNETSLTKPDRNKRTQPSNKALSPEQLKTQLEHNLSKKINVEPPKQADKQVNNFREPKRLDTELQKEANTNRFSKLGIRVLPVENNGPQNLSQPARSPKANENSQNDNNINLEKKMVTDGVDEVDKKKPEAPPVKKREKINRSTENITKEVKEDVHVNEKEEFKRQNSLTSSGIKRDKDGIPQEIPDHIMNAAVAARKNRKSAETQEKIEELEVKSPKKQKGKAPLPPEALKFSADPEKVKNITSNLDEISHLIEDNPQKESQNLLNKTDDSIAGIKESQGQQEKDYGSDSDMETDAHSSVNTIELNSSDITIHHTEGDSEVKNRKTASTGDLSKIQKDKTPTGTLERAQSLDITDSGMPLTKKRKASKEDDELETKPDDLFYDKTTKNKEPRLSLALDGLDTFQRNRLKKSTEWGNLEDAIMSLDKIEVEIPDATNKIEFAEPKSPIKFDFGAKDTHFGTEMELDSKMAENSNKEFQIDLKNIDFGAKEPKSGTKNQEIGSQSTEIGLKESEFITDFRLEALKVTEEILKDDIIKIDDVDVNIIQVQNEIWRNFDIKIEEESPKEKEKPESNVNISSYKLKLHNTEDIPTEIDVDKMVDKVEIEVNQMEAEVNKRVDQIEEPVIEVSKIEIKNKVWPQFEEEMDQMETPKVETVIIETKMKEKPEVTVSSTKITQEPGLSLQIEELHKENVDMDVELPKVNIKMEETSIFHPGKSSQNLIFAEKFASSNDHDYLASKFYDTNASDDIKVSRHSLGSLERPKSDVLKSVNKLKMQNLISSDKGGVSNITINENLNKNGVPEDKSEVMVNNQNVTVTDLTFDNNSLLNDSPSSLTIDTSSDGPDSIKSHTLTFVTEIQVSTPTNGVTNQNKPEIKKEEVLKRLPEMKFSTSSYETTTKIPEKGLSQIEILRSNFEKAPQKNLRSKDPSPSRSRIPVRSPEKKLEHENETEIVEVQNHNSPPVTSQRHTRSQNSHKNVTVTAIRTSSKIPSGSHHHVSNYNHHNKPPVNPNKSNENNHETRNGNNGNHTETLIKQWVFNPDNSVTNIVVDNKDNRK